MNQEYLKSIWEQEEEVAHIHGWDFSHIHGRYEEENDLPWDYENLVINRHGSFDARELFRLLRPNGLFLTEQVGGDNDRDLESFG